LHPPFEGLIQSTAGPAFVRAIGHGQRLLVFHGGPGFDHTSIIDGVRPISGQRTLVFFDQLGCGATPAPDGPVTAEATFAHAAAILEALADDGFGILAFSWGSVVAAAAVAAQSGFEAAETILICPSPIDSESYAKARTAIGSRIPPEAMQEMMAMLEAGAGGAEAFARVLPYYVADPEHPLPPIAVNPATYASVDASLGPFDFRDALARMGRITVIRGEEDYAEESAIAPVLDAAARRIDIECACHFPFLEQPEAFREALLEAVADGDASTGIQH